MSIRKCTTGPRPSQGQSHWGVAVPGLGARQGSRPPARLGIPGGPEAEGVSGYTCQAAANSRPRPRRDLVTRGRQDRHPIPHPGIGPSPCLLAFALALLKQRQSTPTAIFSLPQKPPLRQTPVSSFSAMPPASARWEMKAGELGGTQAAASLVPCVQETTTPSMPLSSRRPPLFQAHVLEQKMILWTGEAGAKGSSSPLIGGGWGFCPPVTAAAGRGRQEHGSFFLFFFKLEPGTRRRRRGEHCSCPQLVARARERRRVPGVRRILCADP